MDIPTIPVGGSSVLAQVCVTLGLRGDVRDDGARPFNRTLLSEIAGSE